MAKLSLSLLGRPRIERDGVPVEIGRRKTIALLTYLAVTGEPHHRDKLAALFWPRFPRDRARAALRRTLTEVRQAIGEEWLQADGDMVGLRFREGLWLDVQQFNSLLARLEGPGDAGQGGADLALLKKVVDLYRSDFLSEFLLDSNSTFSEWQFFQADALRKRVVATLDRLVEGHVDAGEHGLGIAYARRRLALDPLAENAHRQLMRLYAVTGQTSLAVRQYRECCRKLQREIGVQPEEETERLYQDILARRPVFPKEPPHVPVKGGATAAPSAEASSTRGRRGRRFLRSPAGIAALAMIALVMLGATAYLVVSRVFAPRVLTLAVLSLAGRTGEGNPEGFTAGMEDALLTELAKVPRLEVRPRTATAGGARAGTVSFAETAKTLGVAYLLDGSVFLVGNRVRVSLRLIDARHDRILWADGFEHTLDDPFSVQASVARDSAAQVGRALGLE